MSESKEEVVYPDVLQYMEIKPNKKHSATVIFLHVSTIHIFLVGYALIWFWSAFLGTGG